MWAASMPFAGVLPLVQLGHYGGMADEIDALKRDKNVLMLELVRLRQQQQVRRWALCEPYVVAARLVLLLGQLYGTGGRMALRKTCSAAGLCAARPTSQAGGGAAVLLAVLYV